MSENNNDNGVLMVAVPLEFLIGLLNGDIQVSSAEIRDGGIVISGKEKEKRTVN